MIELYIKILILEKHPNAYADYQLFCTFEIEQSCCSQKYTDAFHARYIKRKNLAVKSKSSYLHFGWLDSIEDYNTKKSNRYSIYGILDYLMEGKKEGESLEHIKTLYKMCHGYVHGSTIHVKYPLLQYFEISSMICLVIEPVFTDIYRCLSLEMAEEDKFLLDILDRDFKKLDEQYGKRSTENFELYYKLHTR